MGCLLLLICGSWCQKGPLQPALDPEVARITAVPPTDSAAQPITVSSTALGIQVPSHHLYICLDGIRQDMDTYNVRQVPRVQPRGRATVSLADPQTVADTSTPTLDQLSEQTAVALFRLLPCAMPLAASTTLCAQSKSRPGIAGETPHSVNATEDEACEAAALNVPGAGGAGYTAAAPAGDSVELAARNVTGNRSRSSALEPSVRFAHYEAVKAAATVGHVISNHHALEHVAPGQWCQSGAACCRPTDHLPLRYAPTLCGRNDVHTPPPHLLTSAGVSHRPTQFPGGRESFRHNNGTDCQAACSTVHGIV